MLQRGEKLDDLVDKSEALSLQSKAFYKTARLNLPLIIIKGTKSLCLLILKIDLTSIKKQRKTMGACRVLANVRVDFDVEHNIIYLILVYM